VSEPGTELVNELMAAADVWLICRIGVVEVQRALQLAAGRAAARAFEAEWGTFGVIEVDQELVESAARLTSTRDLRSLDALHLAAALLVGGPDLRVATWDRRLHAAALAEGLAPIPERLRR
jgi:uncharacterized protein